MILILSDSRDTSTYKVIEWLDNLSKKWICITEQDIVNIIFVGDDIVLSLNEAKVRISEISGFWYRRGKIDYNNFSKTKDKVLSSIQQEETEKILEFIYYKLTKINHINSFLRSDVNKLIISSIAKELKIKTPNDYLFSCSKHLFNKTQKGKFITKSICGGDNLKLDNFIIYNYASILNSSSIDTEVIFPSLIQNYIQKKYEIRIFYLKGNFYSMIIFSQKDNQTSVDFRVYNYKNPNRTVPYKLPKKIEYKLDLLMRNIGVNCGSIDMIVTPENEYVFLEVNPVGQFGMVSYPCNYNLEKIIAEEL